MKINNNDPCWCGSGRKYKVCHKRLDEKIEEYKNKGIAVPRHELLKTPEQISKIKESAAINVAVLDYVQEHIKPGTTTQEIDDWVYDITKKMGGIPAPLNFEGYPKSVCTSINNVVCHGIPNEETILVEGDIVNVDVSTNLNGYYSDSSRMFCIGKTSAEAKALVDITKESVYKSLEAVKPWGYLGDIGQIINDMAKSHGYSVVEDIGGHGIGLEFHEEPWISYVTEKGTGMLLVPGFMFTIEPMINAGEPDVYVDDEDDWTVYTVDDSLSAQWEIQVLVTEDGYEIISY